MSNVNGDIARLLPMLDMAYQAEQLKMAKITNRMAQLRRQLAALDRPKTGSSDPFSAAVVAGADLLWTRWAQDRKALINRELARAARDREQAKGGLINALSKLEAAKQMQVRVVQDQRRLAERRASL